MRISSPVLPAETTKTARTGVRAGEQSFGVLSDVARLLWPSKTAAHLASAIGCSERAAEFYLAGHREWSGNAVAVLVGEIMRRHGARNIKIVSR